MGLSFSVGGGKARGRGRGLIYGVKCRMVDLFVVGYYLQGGGGGGGGGGGWLYVIICGIVLPKLLIKKINE